ncbi:hypothetical protein JDV02_000146 [Purpureocillium takamizusanense]|uniref:Uncharacterized protein n=1 Tax=Purpureocillium takamizusanense TaxID=2060973 RepID=A0A9Q8V584_9HYPO|nr:uncharacterized protein JDV02_000146 [Purpureocillium takamizusanense]UNI13398.1 hypothetical protein JDV02_000146 [Purpureocillium takamizusanense]
MPGEPKAQKVERTHVILHGHCKVDTQKCHAPQFGPHVELGIPRRPVIKAPDLIAKCSSDLPPDHPYILFPERFSYAPVKPVRPPSTASSTSPSPSLNFLGPCIHTRHETLEVDKDSHRVSSSALGTAIHVTTT